MIDYIKENISWLKDFFTLVFVGTGTVVAILTYRRARATILQHIRTEVIKKQSELLSKLLQTLSDNNQSFEVGLDYVNLVQINVMLTLRDYGFVFNEHKELFEKIKDSVVGWIPCGRKNILKDVEIIGAFTEPTEKKKESEYGVEKFNNLKKGEIDIDKIYLTKRHSEFVKMISDFKGDPFTPTSIQQTMTELLNDINNNLAMVLKGELEVFMIDFSKVYFERGNAPHFHPVGVYNSYNHSRVHHRQTLDKLKNEIRKYLRIDEGW
jgi:hypothetical protein